MRLLITRPDEDAQCLAAELEAMGHTPVMHPLLSIEYPPAGPLPLDNAQALAATSRNALRGLAKSEALAEARRLPLFCAAASTAKLAAQLGFAQIYAGAGAAKDLPAAIQDKLSPGAGPLIYLAGDHLAFDLPGALHKLGYAVTKFIVYNSVAAQSLPAWLQTDIRTGKLDGVILLSPRTAGIYAALIHGHKLSKAAQSVKCYCLSQNVASRLDRLDKARVMIAKAPSVHDMLALIGPAAAGLSGTGAS